MIVWYAGLLCLVNLGILLGSSGLLSAVKIDPGVATLAGAIIGLSIVGVQAQIGFNLIASQENQADIELRAQIHKQMLDEQERNKLREAERKLLVDSLMAEMTALAWNCLQIVHWAQSVKHIYEDASMKNIPGVEIPYREMNAVVFGTNI